MKEQVTNNSKEIQQQITTIKYVAFLRGINFGGNKKIDMKELKKVFESLGFLEVSTYMNSGNVIFLSNTLYEDIAKNIEKAIIESFQFEVRVLVITSEDLLNIHQAIPISWQSEVGMLPHIAFLWKEIDNSNILKLMEVNPEEHAVKYIPGALLWNVELKTWSKDKVYRYLNNKVSQQVTIRSINTIKRLSKGMQNN